MRWWLLAVVLAVAVTESVSPAAASGSYDAGDSFYNVSPSQIHGPPGSLIRFEPLFGAAPVGAVAYRILYRSRGLANQPIAVSGLAIVPTAPAPPGGRNVVAWAHPTTGIARGCAPSLSIYGLSNIPDLEELVERGYIVTATDYPGLGTAGPHPYLVGLSEGRAVLDSVRAVRNLPGSGASARFALWGHSQGGHAVLFAGEIARSYAPDLRLVGIAAAAPATALAALVKADINTLQGKIFLAATLVSWSRVFHIPITTVVAPEAVPTAEAIARDCVETSFELFYVAASGYPLQQSFLIADPTQLQPWRSLIARNTPGAPGRVPVLLVQSAADDVVQPTLTKRYAATLCHHGDPITYLSLSGVTHAMTARAGATATIAWIANRFAGVPPPNECFH